MARLTDKQVCNVPYIGVKSISLARPATEKARSPILSWCEGCRIRSSLRNEADDGVIVCTKYEGLVPL